LAKPFRPEHADECACVVSTAGVFRLRFVNPKYWNGNVETALEATYKIKRYLGFYRWI